MLQTLSSPLVMPVTTLLHHEVEPLSYVRWSDGSNVKQRVDIEVQGDGSDEQRVVTELTLDPAKFDASGWREVRITSNMAGSRREFTTTRTCVFVVNGKSRRDYCGGPTVAGRCGGGAWYPDTLYRIVMVDCRDVAKAQTGSFNPGDTVRVKFQNGPGFANLDPAFHAGNPGTVLGADLAMDKWQKITIPTDAPAGAHKLHLRATGAGAAGAYVLAFTVTGAR